MTIDTPEPHRTDDDGTRLVDPIVAENLRRYLEHPDDIAALFYLAVSAALDDTIPATARTVVDLAGAVIGDEIDANLLWADAMDNLIAALWPELGEDGAR